MLTSLQAGLTSTEKSNFLAVKTKFKRDPEAIKRLISKDGVHLTGEGLSLMAQNIAPLLEQLINPKQL